MKAALQICLPLCLFIAACGDEPISKRVVRVVHTDLLDSDERYEVTRSSPGAEVRRMILTPSLSVFVDGGDLPSLVMPPSAEVKIAVPSTGGPFVLRGAAGLDLKSGKPLTKDSEPISILFELEVDGERRFESQQRLKPRAGIKGASDDPMSWVRLGGSDGIRLSGGETLTLRTDLLTSSSIPAEELLCGFGGLVLEVVTEREHLSATPETPNIVFVVMDTLRADRTNLDGYELDTTPNLARIAEEAIVYENAISTSSWTWPATASFLTGLPPEAHGVLLHRSSWLAHSLETLAEALQERGYTTGGFSANPLVSADKNFAQGFEEYRAPATEFVSGDKVLPECFEWVKRNKEHRFFLYLHLADPHVPHEPHPEELARLGFQAPADFPPRGFEIAHTALRQQLLLKPFGVTRPEKVLSKEHLEWLDKEYDACVATGDRNLGLLLDLLKEEGLMEKTVIAFVGDHGEELLDHGGLDHARTLHPELIRVPMLLMGPGITPTKISSQTSTRHMGSTLAKIGGAELSAAKDAIDLSQRDHQRAAAVFFRTDKGGWGSHPKTTILGVRSEGLSLHWAPQTEEDQNVRLYDHIKDPQEMKDIAAQRPLEVERMKALILTHQGSWAADLPNALEGGARAAEMLRAVGYAGDEE
jgi:arylsulfatase A-like enzyme